MHTENRNLLSIIQEMYSRVVCSILNSRIQQYCTRHHTGDEPDISSQLSKHIDSISEHVNSTKVISQTDANNSLKQEEKSNQTRQTSKPEQSRTVDTKKANALSKYFKQRGNGATLNPGIEDTLTHSIWEHIHMSLRQARQGNTKGAKMHADIANHAYKELAHYMTEEKYIELTNDIEKELNI
jgi:hypothetical protein